MQRRLGQADLDLLLDAALGDADEIADRGVVVLADRLVEARHRARGLADLLQVLQRDLRRVRDLLVGRRPAELGDQLALRAPDLLLAVGDVDGNADRARLVRDAALHRLPDPPRRIGRELEAPPPVELLDGADQPDHTLLDQVEEREPVALVLLRDRDDETKVRVDHPVLRLDVAALDQLRQLDLLGGGQQRVAARLVEEQLQRVGRRRREVAVDVGRVDGGRAAAVVREADPALLELLIERLELLVLELQILDRGAELGEVEAACLLAGVEHGCECLAAHRCGLPLVSVKRNPVRNGHLAPERRLLRS